MSNNITKVFISGPMTGYPQFNYKAFNAAAEKLSKEGLIVINPVDFDKEYLGEDYMNKSPDDPVFKSEALVDCMKAEIENLVDCDIIYLLKGWQNSTGSRAELKAAMENNLTIRLEE